MGKRKRSIAPKKIKRSSKKFHCLKCGQDELAMVSYPPIGPRKAKKLDLPERPKLYAMKCNNCDEFHAVTPKPHGYGYFKPDEALRAGKILAGEYGKKIFTPVDAYGDYINVRVGLTAPTAPHVHTSSIAPRFEPTKLKTTTLKKAVRKISESKGEAGQLLWKLQTPGGTYTTGTTKGVGLLPLGPVIEKKKLTSKEIHRKKRERLRQLHKRSMEKSVKKMEEAQRVMGSKVTSGIPGGFSSSADVSYFEKI